MLDFFELFNAKMARPNYILGLDLGTTSVKACLIDKESRKIIAKQSKATQAGEGAQQDVSKIISALHNCLGRIPKDLLKNVSKIGICGQMHGILFWKHDTGGYRAQSKGNERYELGKGPISSLYTWQDSRCTPEFLNSLPKPNSHLRIATGYGCATLLWKIKYEPQELLQYDRSGSIQDFLVAMLCNLDHPITSVQNAASWGYFNTQDKEWNLDILKSINFPTGLLPTVMDSGEIAGKLDSNWFGILKGAEILAPLGDMQCSVLSILSCETVPTAVLNISTSAQLSFQMPADFIPPSTLSSIEYFPYFSNRYLAVAASLNGGNVMASFVRMLQSWLQDLGFNAPQHVIWEKILTLARNVEPGETEMTINPTLFGERHLLDSLPVASVHSITQKNTGLGNVARALSSGLVANLHKYFNNPISLSEIRKNSSLYLFMLYLMSLIRNLLKYLGMIFKILLDVINVSEDNQRHFQSDIEPSINQFSFCKLTIFITPLFALTVNSHYGLY